MKLLLFIIALALSVVAWDAGERLIERHNTDPEYLVRGVSQLEVEISPGKYEPHVGAYKAKNKLSYCITRVAYRTVTAKPARRIVQRTVNEKGQVGKKFIYQFPVPNPSVTVMKTPPEGEEAHVTVELPGPDVLPPGKDYVIESSVEFPAHGEREARTYPSYTQPFDVE